MADEHTVKAVDYNGNEVMLLHFYHQSDKFLYHEGIMFHHT